MQKFFNPLSNLLINAQFSGTKMIRCTIVTERDWHYAGPREIVIRGRMYRFSDHSTNLYRLDRIENAEMITESQIQCDELIH